MITRVRVTNFALIDSVELALDSGLTVLTGETGAGKTLLMDAVAFAAGTRANRSMVGPRGDTAEVEVDFTGPKGATTTVERRFNSSGRSRQKLDGESCRVRDLRRELGPAIDYSGQFESQRLLSSSSHRGILDRFGGESHRDRVARLDSARSELRRLNERLRELRRSREERESEIHRLEDEIERLEEVGVGPGELEELEDERDLLKKGEQVIEEMETARDALTGEDTGGAAGLLEEAARAVDRLQDLLSDRPDDREQLEAYAEQLRNASSTAADASLALGDLRNQLSLDPDRMNEVQERISEIYRLEQRFGTPASDLPDLLEKKRERLDMLSGTSGDVDDLKERKAELEEQVRRVYSEVETERGELSERVEEAVHSYLSRLGCEGAEFVVRLEASPDPLREQQRVEFLISMNPGEVAKPLVEVASGGEASRVMLSLKAALAGAGDVRVLMFDEIDAGVGGETAHAVAEVLAELAAGRQVLVISHFAQIAAAAEHHLAVEKEVLEGVTRIDYRELSGSDRVREMARLLGDRGAEKARDLAREMLEERTPSQPD